MCNFFLSSEKRVCEEAQRAQLFCMKKSTGETKYMESQL